ncbi:hypothetical protein B7P34_36325 [Streptosporangium nondiastaticum]|uniref:Uncharacterized protein n=1 Tax=Streptosporangium nondiastaticum TaxID=35764 RepID=A0A9X7JHQ3_9ACTN|nr:hypothetical protein [Streptosporangium nondiastaticum]PSJ23893.1 hypothetical protein B7P34_36325 [Streptosporangium nondiastaticum]
MTNNLIDGWLVTPGQCLSCGGRGGWWSGEFRETCTRCGGDGWDPMRDEPWFAEFVLPLQVSSGSESF